MGTKIPKKGKNGDTDPQNELKWGQLLQQLPWRHGTHVYACTFPKWGLKKNVICIPFLISQSTLDIHLGGGILISSCAY